MQRLGIASRIALIVLAALVVVQVLMLAAYFAERRRASGATTLSPLVGQVAAVVRLMDRLDESERRTLLQAAGAVGFRPRWPVAAPADMDVPVYLRPFVNRIRQLAGGPEDRPMVLSLIGPPRTGGAPVTRLRDLASAQLRAVIGLSDGSFLEITAGSSVVLRLLGIPLGIIAGLLSLTVALLALLAVRREMRPLSELAREVERFGTRLDPNPLPERGAPDVRGLVRAVNLMQARIAELVRTRSLVLGAISHDLKTYITRLRLRLEFLPDEPQVEKARADLEHMQALLDDALSFARSAFSDAGGESADLAALVRAECEASQTEGRPVTLEGAQVPLRVRGSAYALRRVIANLVCNAIAYGQQADVMLRAVPEGVELRVADRGPGIPEDVRQQVFEPFYRLEPSRSRSHGGAGLGLTIVRQIVEGLGGRIDISDRPGGGACFSVVLPAA